MVTKHKITGWYHVELRCDKCGTKMNNSQLKIIEPFVDGDGNKIPMQHFYASTCPKCGNEVDTGDVQYPHTMYEYELEGSEVNEKT